MGVDLRHFGETCISAPSGLSAAAAVAVSAGTVLSASASTPTVLAVSAHTDAHNW